MANYCATVRTNYFRVTDEVQFRRIVDNMRGEDTIEIFEENKDGESMFGFGCYGVIHGIVDYTLSDDEGCDEDADVDRMIDELQKILHPDDAIIIMEAGYEKLRYVVGVCTVITCSNVRTVCMLDSALELAREMLTNRGYSTQLDY